MNEPFERQNISPKEHEKHFGPLLGRRKILDTFVENFKKLNPDRRELALKLENNSFADIVEENLKNGISKEQIKNLIKIKIEYHRDKWGKESYYENEYKKALVSLE